MDVTAMTTVGDGSGAWRRSRRRSRPEDPAQRMAVVAAAVSGGGSGRDSSTGGWRRRRRRQERWRRLRRSQAAAGLGFFLDFFGDYFFLHVVGLSARAKIVFSHEIALAACKNTDFHKPFHTCG